MFMKPVMTLLLTLLLCLSALAQQSESSRFEMHRSGMQGVDIEFALGSYSLYAVAPDTLGIMAAGSEHHSMIPHSPLVPVWQQIITVPEGAVVDVDLQEQREEQLLLKKPLRQVGTTQTKSGRKMEAAGRQGAANGPVSVRMLGKMRGVNLALVTVSPFRVRHDTLLACKHLQGRISFRHADEAATQAQWQKHASPWFAGMMPQEKSYHNSLSFGNVAPGYLVLAPSRFQSTLQPFVQWKRACGFAVAEIYNDLHQRDSIKAVLQHLYDSSSMDRPFPTFLLLVGNTADIPPFFGTHSPAELDISFTDLPYADFTGDCLPDILLGRWPVSDTSQLRQVIEKTLAYEQCRLEDETYLERAMLVAGNEGRSPAPAYTNAQVHYLSQAFAQKGIDTIAFCNPAFDTLDPAWSASRKSQVLEALSQGVGHVNYTGHAKYFGWTSPTVSGNDINTLPSNGRYAFVVNNCCRSCEFGGNSMGEQWLRKPQGGAIAVIGSTNETLWDEDFYFSVGQKDTLLTDYDSSALGAYDRYLHSHGEDFQQWVLNAAQMLLAGNMAVVESGSPYAEYYWENYLLMGDPSLIPYAGRPSSIVISCMDSLSSSTSSISVQGTPYAYVALAEEGTLLGVCTLDAEGQGTIVLCQPPSDSIVTLTATLSGCRPAMDTLAVMSEMSIWAERDAPLVKLYPNPAQGEMTIDLGRSNERVQIEIRDVQGRLVDMLDNNSQQHIQYAIHHLSAGLYLVVIRSNSDVVVKNLIVQP